jgi:16S rRNA (uracil1498-N3)-methyltransferase
MHEALRRSAGHVLLADVDTPVADAPTTHHLARVLRLRDGAVVTVTDGAGRWRTCRWGGGLQPDGEVIAEPRPADVTVAVAPPKGDRLDWLVQKVTEVGVTRVVLLVGERSVLRWDPERADRQLDRLRRIAAEAAMQSRRVWLPELCGPFPAADVLASTAVAEPGGRPIGAGDRSIAIGPEGGWSPSELALATDRVSLGATVLRVETAAVVAATLMVAAS